MNSKKISIITLGLVAAMTVTNAFAMDNSSASSTKSTPVKTTKIHKGKTENHIKKTDTKVEKNDTNDSSKATSTKKTSILNKYFGGKKKHSNNTQTVTTNSNNNKGPVTAICNDGSESHANTHEGACTSHGGVKNFVN